MASKDLVPVQPDPAEALFQRAIQNVRDDVLDNTYIREAVRVLPVKGYRSAIGSFWNAVVDDLRNKVMHRSLSLFNKAVPQKREIKCYEDFQNLVNDDDLIDGSYKIGVIGWEAAKVLRHAKETRHIFDGHPNSSEPSVFKVLAMFDDCAKYVLNEPYPAQVVDIDDYLATMATPDFDRNEVALANAITELPEVYKKELINRLFTAYVFEGSPTELRSNIELVAPILWKVLPKELKIQIVRRVDQEISKGNATKTKDAFRFVRLVKASAYLTATAKKYVVQPLVTKLAESLDKFDEEDKAIKALAPYASIIPPDLLPDYVTAITHTFVGKTGFSNNWARTDFYADAAATRIPKMVESFDDAASAAFVECIRTSETLRRRIENPDKLNRLQSLANVVLSRISDSFPDKKLLESLVDTEREAEFWKLAK